jgi:hypothetical protein
MTPFLRATLMGCAIEAGFGELFAVGGFGPCGPGNPLGLVGVIAHVPGILGSMALSAIFHVPDAVGPAVIIVFQLLFWTLLIWGFLRAVRQPRSSADA